MKVSEFTREKVVLNLGKKGADVQNVFQLNRLRAILCKRSSSDDTYLNCPIYYLVTGRGKIEIYIRSDSVAIVSQHPHLKNRILLYLPMEANACNELPQRVLGGEERSKQHFVLARATSKHAEMLQRNHTNLLRAFVDYTMDWAYPIHILDTASVANPQGIKYAKIRNKLRRGKPYIGQIVRYGNFPKTDFMSVLGNWKSRLKSASGDAAALNYYESFAGLATIEGSRIESLIAYDQNSQPIGATCWATVTDNAANQYVHIAHPSVVGLSETLIVELCRSLSKQDVVELNLGGSETASLDAYKRKFCPIRSLHRQSFFIPNREIRSEHRERR